MTYRYRELRLLVLLQALLLSVSACSWFSDDEAIIVRAPAIADVIRELPEPQFNETRLDPPSREEVMEAYRRVYGVMPDAVENHAVGRRLADLEMAVGEDKDIEGQKEPYRAAIELYETLLANTADEDRDEVLYQLARAHDVVGEGDIAQEYLDQLIDQYPDSQYIAEARFRRAEMLFSAEDYRAAAKDYAFVVDQGGQTPYLRNASYLLGWSHFKLSQLDDALASFFGVIDDLLKEQSAEQLSSANAELLNDTLRVITQAVSYLDGAETLAQHMNSLGKPEWQYLVYMRLATDYREKERFLDSVNTVQTFITYNPLDARAPRLHREMIDTLIEADFPGEVLPKKEEYIQRYGIRSEFWDVHNDVVKASYRPTLKKYLGELTKLAHADAQKSNKREDYLKAAEWYEQTIVTFPEDPNLAENFFLLGEVYTEAGEYAQAVAAYQRVVREYPDDENANEAGYAAILALNSLLGDVPDSEREIWQRLKIDAQIEFAMVFPGDERAASVQADAANALFKLQQFPEAVELAQHLLTTRPGLVMDLRKTALLIVGHGLFEMNDFVAAEAAYKQLQAMGQIDDKIQERLLAAIYKQAESAESSGDMDAAIANYMRIQQEAPQSELAIKGQYDAIAVIEGQDRWAEAARLLEDFRTRYPQQTLDTEIPKRLADLYEKSQSWQQAAAEYQRIAASDGDVEVKREAKYRAGELFLKTGDIEDAVATFRDYAHTYIKPTGLRLEAMNHMDELYQQLGEPDKRRFWLHKKIELQADLGNSPDDQQVRERATFLAAEAQSVLAADKRYEFDRVILNRPLKKSLKRKQKALKSAVASFEKVADYGVQQFATAATYEIADIYASLSESLLNSDRPKGLSEMELEQYQILLEEQAYPFEEQAITLHEINMRRSWDGVYDESVQKSFAALKKLMPGRFDKTEVQVAYVDTIY